MMLELAIDDEPAEAYNIANIEMVASDTIRITISGEADIMTIKEQLGENKNGEIRYKNWGK